MRSRRRLPTASDGPSAATSCRPSCSSSTSTGYFCAHSALLQRGAGREGQAGVPARSLRQKRAPAHGSGRPHRQHQGARAVEGVRGRRVGALHQSAAAAPQRGSAGRARAAGLDNRPQRKDHAARLQEAPRLPPEDHRNRAEVLPRAAQPVPFTPLSLVFVNTPMLFDTIWAKITPLISKDTLDKVVMIGDESGNLFEYAQPDILPEFLGGEVSEEDFLAERREGKK